MRERLEKLLQDANGTTRDYVQDKLMRAVQQKIVEDNEDTRRLIVIVLSAVDASHQNNLKMLSRTLDGIVSSK